MGGAERVTLALAHEAARSGLFEGVDVFVLAWSRSGTLDQLERERGVRLHYALAPTTSRGILPLIRFLAARRFEFVFSSATHLNAICSAMRKLGLLRTARLVSRESTDIFDRDLGRHGPISRLLYRVYGAQDLIVCQTERMRRSLNSNTQNRLDSRLKVIANPIDPERLEAGRRAPPPEELATIAPDRLRIVWCGRLAPVKSPFRAIDVLRVLHERGLTSTHLILIGDGPLRSALALYASDAGLADAVTFAGHQDNPLAAMAGAGLGLVTSDVEGFPNVILEMLGAGVPAIVTTDCAGDLDRLPSTFVSPATGPDSLADTALAALAVEPSGDAKAFLAQRSPASMLRSLVGAEAA